MADPNFRYLEANVEQGILVLTVLGRKIQGEKIATELRAEMLDAVERYPSSQVIVDFRNTEYVSSVAFWPLLSLYRKLLETGGRLTVCGLSPIVGDVFFTTRLVSAGGSCAAPFGLEKDKEAALRRLSEPRQPPDMPNSPAQTSP